MKDFFKVNLNVLVKFKFNELGEKRNKNLKNPIEKKEDGFYYCQLWEIIKFFGENFYVGSDGIFQDNSVIIYKSI